MTIDILPRPFIFPPLLSRRGQLPSLASPSVYCKECRRPLIEISVNNHYRIVCDNHECRLFRERQGSREREQEQKPPPVKRVVDLSRILRPSYSISLEKRKERYHLARRLGFGSIEAMLLRGKSREEIERLAGVC